MLKQAAILLALLVTGCAQFHTTQKDITYDRLTGKKVREITTRAGTGTFFDAKSKLADFKAVQTDKSQGASVGTFNGQSTSTNVVRALEEINKILSKVP